MRTTLSTLAVTLCLASLLPTSGWGDVIYHFTPAEPGGPTVQIDFSSALPVSGTEGWSLPPGAYFGEIEVTAYGLPQVGIFPIPPVIIGPADIPQLSVSSYTGATLDGGMISAMLFPLFDAGFSFGSFLGGRGSAAFGFRVSPTPDEYTTVTYDGTWSLGPAMPPVPEPASVVTLGLGLVGLGLAARLRRR